jgi:hypothetical protein
MAANGAQGIRPVEFYSGVLRRWSRFMILTVCPRKAWGTDPYGEEEGQDGPKEDLSPELPRDCVAARIFSLSSFTKSRFC